MIHLDKSHTSKDKDYKEDSVISPSNKDWKWLPLLVSRSKSSPTIGKPRTFIDPRVMRQKHHIREGKQHTRNSSEDNLFDSRTKKAPHSRSLDKSAMFGSQRFVFDRPNNKVSGNQLVASSDSTVEGFAQHSLLKLRKTKAKFPALKEEVSQSEYRPERWQWRLHQGDKHNVLFDTGKQPEQKKSSPLRVLGTQQTHK